ncbi:UNVERIFIED_ORG: hypothetical protein [Escherichia phage CMSTMSU]
MCYFAGGQRGAGGGLSWRNNIPVSGGEYLSVSLTSQHYYSS